MPERRATVARETRETKIRLELDIDGKGRYQVQTGIGMMDHMLEQLARHGLFNLAIEASGDIERDPHHLVEDLGLSLGRAFDQALGSVIKRLVSWTLRTPPPRPPSDLAPYEIERYRNPTNAVVDTENCPVGNDASKVPYTAE